MEAGMLEYMEDDDYEPTVSLRWFALDKDEPV
jgi:hypothetical protein